LLQWHRAAAILHEDSMSIFGAMTTAVSGLQAQSGAFTNISDNIANSQSVGYKGVNTNFIDYLTQSSPTTNGPESVVAHPDYTNDVQGAITQSSDPLALAISGQGYFSVSEASSSSAGTGAGAIQSFSAQPEYTRAGDFTLDKNGYLVNGEGAYLNGWSVNSATGAANTSVIAPIQIAQGTNPPVATSNVTLSAELPATPTAGTPVSTQINVYDSLGTMHQLDLNWTQNATNDWTVAVTAPDSSPASLGTAEVKFGNASGNPVAAGTIGSLSNATGGVTATSYGANGPAALSFSADFGNGAQPVTLNLGNFGSTTGVTQYSGTSFNLLGTTQNGQAQGSFSNLAIDSQGNVSVNYSNGNSKVVAQVPIATFAAPDALQGQPGQSYTASQGSGSASVNAIGADGAGSLVTGATEGSNVDISTEFTKLITAQEAYSANAKVITTANQLSQTTLNMLQ
jgi:flagellar hook protein FlgE